LRKALVEKLELRGRDLLISREGVTAWMLDWISFSWEGDSVVESRDLKSMVETGLDGIVSDSRREEGTLVNPEGWNVSEASDIVRDESVKLGGRELN
jgi:hypothetical protein